MRAWTASAVAISLLALAGCTLPQPGVEATRSRQNDGGGTLITPAGPPDTSVGTTPDTTPIPVDVGDHQLRRQQGGPAVRRVPHGSIQRHRRLLESAVPRCLRQRLHAAGRGHLCRLPRPNRADPRVRYPTNGVPRRRGQRLLLRRRRLHGLRRCHLVATAGRSARAVCRRRRAGPRVRSCRAVPSQRVPAADDPQRAAGRLLRRRLGGARFAGRELGHQVLRQGRARRADRDDPGPRSSRVRRHHRRELARHRIRSGRRLPGWLPRRPRTLQDLLHRGSREQADRHPVHRRCESWQPATDRPEPRPHHRAQRRGHLAARQPHQVLDRAARRQQPHLDGSQAHAVLGGRRLTELQGRRQLPVRQQHRLLRGRPTRSSSTRRGPSRTSPIHCSATCRSAT